MNIDIKRFALLTSAIAASVTVVATAATGCSSNAVDDTDVDAGDDDTTSSSSSGGSSSGDGGGSSSSGDGGGSSSGDGGSDAGSCLAGGETIADETAFCAVVDGSQTCSGDETYFTDYCLGGAQNFNPSVARDAIECIKSSPTCESEERAACLPDAVAKACDDASAETYCAGLAAAKGCDPAPNDGSPFTVANCVALAKAMTPEQREFNIGSCVEESMLDTLCDDETVGTCFEALTYSFGSQLTD